MPRRRLFHSARPLTLLVIRLNKPNSPAPTRPAPGPAAAPRRSRRFWVAVAVLVPLVGLAGWGVWKLTALDPLRAARAALDRRDFAAADALLAKRLTERPDDPDALLLSARLARRADNPTRAFGLLRNYQQRHGTNPAYELESRMLRAQGGDAVEADRLFAEYTANPDAPDAPLLLEAYLEGKLRAVAARAGQSGEPASEDALAAVEKAAPDLNRAIDLWQAARPGRADQAQARIWRARLLLASNRHEGGVAALREAVELAPDRLEPRFQLALAISLTDPGEAMRHLEALQTVQPDNPFVRLGLANTYRMLGRGPDARRIYDGLLTGPHRIDAMVELGTLDMEEGKLDAAERNLRSALDAAPSSPATNMAMSRLHQLAGRPDEAAKYRKRFDELDAEQKKPRP